jgi:hypothetical protein
MPLLFGAVFAAGAAPATTSTPPAGASPAAATENNADRSSPVAAARTLLTALQEGDIAAARDTLVISADQKPAIDAFLDVMAATARLQHAASAKYLSAADGLFKPSSPADSDAALKRVDAGELTVNSDSATLRVAADTPTSPGTQPTMQTLELRKIGPAWKVDGPSFFGLTAENAGKTAARAALARKLADVADAVAAEITAGKFFSADGAYHEYWTRCLRVAAATAAATTKP